MRGALHVGALPFPSPQGTQAAIDAMLRAEHTAGRAPRLMTYGEAAVDAADAAADANARTPYEVLRAPRLPGAASSRSGPSVRKVVLDAGLALHVGRHWISSRPAVLVAHHVEAALCCLPFRARTLFVAHTDVGAELPAYLPAAMPGGARARAAAERALTRMGGRLDHALLRAHAAAAAVSPLLCNRLEARAPELAGRITYLPIPWPVVAPADADARERARRSLGLPQDAVVFLYAGNLDAYQGVDVLLGAFARLTRHAEAPRLLVATQSAPAALLREAAGLGISALVHVVPLGDEAARRRAHAAASFCVVPRRAPGGVPIKLLDALSRGVATIAMPRATAGLPLGGAALVAHDDSIPALTAAMAAAYTTPALAQVLQRAGHRYLAQHHDPARYLAVLDSCLRRCGSCATA